MKLKNSYTFRTIKSYDNQLGFNAAIPDDVAFTPSLSLFNQLNQEFSNTLQLQTVSDNLLMPSTMASLVDEGKENQDLTQLEDRLTVENGSNELNQVSFSQDNLPNIAENSFTENEMGPVALNFGGLKKTVDVWYDNFKKKRVLLKNDSKEVRDLGNYPLMANAAYCNSGRISIEYRINESLNDIEIAVIIASDKRSYDSLIKHYTVDQMGYPKPPEGLFSEDWRNDSFESVCSCSIYWVESTQCLHLYHILQDILKRTLLYILTANHEDFRAIIDQILDDDKRTFQIFRVTRADDPGAPNPGADLSIHLSIIKPNIFSKRELPMCIFAKNHGSKMKMEYVYLSILHQV
ncbi:hypothetical protein G9A89_004590 [Geosiphon pyriformis]|nr:hypothetical protein G9A89_004590 [Geosiphon pyriformis]